MVADRWFPSSKRCSGCGTVKPDLQPSERTYRCPSRGLALDRDLNPAINLAGWAHPAVASSAEERPNAWGAKSRSSASLADGGEPGTGTAAARPGSTRTPKAPAALVTAGGTVSVEHDSARDTGPSRGPGSAPEHRPRG